MKSSCGKLSLANYSLICFYFVLLTYPLYTLISALTGTGLFSYTKDVIFVVLAGLSIASLAKNRAFSLDLADLFILGYSAMVIINAVRSPLTIVDTLHSVRYRLFFLVSVNLYFKYLRMKGVNLGQVLVMVMRVLFITGIVVALIAVLEFYQPATIYQLYGENLTPHLRVFINGIAYRRVMSTFANPINLGFYLVLTSIGGLYLVSVQNGWKKALYVPALLLMLFALLHTYARGAYVALICVYIGWYLAFLISNLKLRQMTAKTAMIVTAFLIILSIALSFTDSPFIYRLSKSTLADLNSNARMQNLIDEVSEIYADVPIDELSTMIGNEGTTQQFSIRQLIMRDSNTIPLLFGHGIGTIIGGSRQYVFELGYLSILFESGLVSLLCFLAAVGIGLFRMMRHAFANLKQGEIPWLAITSFMILGALLVTMITEDTYMQMPFSLYYPIALFALSVRKDTEQMMYFSSQDK